MTGGPIPRLVSGTVTRHEPYGFSMRFDGGEDGLVVMTMITDDNAPNTAFPPIGSQVGAILLGFAEIGGQPRLSIRPQDLAAQRG